MGVRYEVKPTIWLTYSMSKTAEAIPISGDGRALGIMRKPREWELNAWRGHVTALMPTAALLGRAKSGEMSFAEYELALGELWLSEGGVEAFAPNRLTFEAPHRYPGYGDNKAVRWDGSLWLPQGLVRDGDTLLCCCKDASRCHRTPAAHLLAAAGWRVMLDGEEVKP